jgi:hypothetical protein
VSIDELEAEFCSRFPPDGSLELLGESWKRVQSILTKSLKELQHTLKIREETDDYNGALNHPHHHHLHHLTHLNNGNHHHTSVASVVDVEEIGPATVELFLLLGVTTPSGLAAAGGDRGMDGMMFTPGAAPHSSPNFLSVLPDPASILLASTPPNQRSSPPLSPSDPHHAGTTSTTMDGGILPSSIPLVPATNVLDLVDFTARYTSLGGEYSQSMSLPWCGVLSTLVSLVQLEADFLEGDGDDESGDNSDDDSSVVDDYEQGIAASMRHHSPMGDKSVQSTDLIEQQLTSTQRHNDASSSNNNKDTGVKSLLPFEAVSKLTTFFAKVSEVMANCCSNASETRSDWALLPVRNHPVLPHHHDTANAAPPLIKSSSTLTESSDAGLRVQVGFPPFALAETAARVWGGSIAVSLLWYDLLTTATPASPPAATVGYDTLPRTDSMSSAKRSPKGTSSGKRRISQMVPSRRLEFLELGCGCALPSCTMAKILLHHLHSKGDCTDEVGEPSRISEALINSSATVNLTVSDWQQVIVTQAIQNIKKNWSATAVLNPLQAAINLSVLTAPRLSVEGQVLDFFAINSPIGPYSDHPNAGITPPPNTSALPPPCVYDLIFGSDIVYDFKIGAEVATSLKHLLRKPSNTTTPFILSTNTASADDDTATQKRRILGELLIQVFIAGSSSRRAGLTADAAPTTLGAANNNHSNGDDATTTVAATSSSAVVPDNLGGIALVCCERHRDGMLLFREQAERVGLQVLLHTDDAEADLLQQFAFPTTTTETSCAVYVVAHAPAPAGGEHHHQGGLAGGSHHHLQDDEGSFEQEECIDT